MYCVEGGSSHDGRLWGLISDQPKFSQLPGARTTTQDTTSLAVN